MKNKIIISIILSAVGIAGFTYINNLQKAKDLYQYNYSSSNYLQKKSADKFSFDNNNVFKTKKSQSKNVSLKSTTGNNDYFKQNTFSKSIVTINSRQDYNPNARVFSNNSTVDEKKKYQISTGLNSMPLFSSNNRTNSYGLTTADNSSSLNDFGRQSAPITTLDGGGGSGKNTIIVDPAGDPIADSRIPIGDGLYILLVLILIYGIKKRKKQTL